MNEVKFDYAYFSFLCDKHTTSSMRRKTKERERENFFAR